MKPSRPRAPFNVAALQNRDISPSTRGTTVLLTRIHSLSQLPPRQRLLQAGAREAPRGAGQRDPLPSALLRWRNTLLTTRANAGQLPGPAQDQPAAKGRGQAGERRESTSRWLGEAMVEGEGSRQMEDAQERGE